MLLKMILDPIFSLIGSLFQYFPAIPKFTYSLAGLRPIFEIINAILPSGFFIKFIGTVLFFKNFSLIWAIVEWCYKKIPGVS